MSSEIRGLVEATVELLEALFGPMPEVNVERPTWERLPAPPPTHKHRCGYGWGADTFPLGPIRYSGQGCGVVFEHVGGSHVCEHCGVSTYWKYDGKLAAGQGKRKARAFVGPPEKDSP